MDAGKEVRRRRGGAGREPPSSTETLLALLARNQEGRTGNGEGGRRATRGEEEPDGSQSSCPGILPLNPLPPPPRPGTLAEFQAKIPLGATGAQGAAGFSVSTLHFRTGHPHMSKGSAALPGGGA